MYRLRLCKGIETNCHWIFLKGSYEVILQRMQQRKEHYMPASLLQSQFDVLEEPGNAITEDISQSPEIIVQHIIKALY